MSNKVVHTAILTAAMMGCLLLGIPAQMQAGNPDNKCEKRIHKAEENLRRAEQRHGEHSKQAEERRHQLEEVRESCHEDRR